jgi:predicted nucleotide-binding protein
VFELGFFIGKLGRDRVCALYQNGVEIPSDYHGVAFVQLDNRFAWQLELAKEIRAAGLPVDLNKVV